MDYSILVIILNQTAIETFTGNGWLVSFTSEFPGGNFVVYLWVDE